MNRPMQRKPCPPPARRQGGYVLVLTIAALAMLAFAAAYVGQQVSTALRLAIAEQDDTDADRKARDALSEVTYLLATTRRNVLGLGGDDQPIRMDGRWYMLREGVFVALQDGRGLINLRSSPRAWRERLLEGYGIPIDQSSPLLDALEDYVDADSLRRLQGAEADDYAQAGLTPPRNQPLVVRRELLNVLGWRRYPKLWAQDGVLDHVTLSSDTGINPATATRRVLVAALNLSERDADAFINARQHASAADIKQIAQPYIGPIRADDFLQLHTPALFPARTTQVKVFIVGRKAGLQARVTITPDQSHFAFQVQDLDECPAPSGDALKNAPPLPDVRAYSAAADQDRPPMLPF